MVADLVREGMLWGIFIGAMLMLSVLAVIGVGLLLHFSNRSTKPSGAAETLEAIKRLIPRKMLFDSVFMERFHRYTRHDHGCTYDDLEQGDICTCGLQAVINDYYEIKEAIDGHSN